MYVRHDGRMTIQLVGVGLGRTGTMSLKLALEQLLGGTCHHMMEVLGHPDEVAFWDAAMRGETVDFPVLLDGYCAIVDYPGRRGVARTRRSVPRCPGAAVDTVVGPGVVAQCQLHHLPLDATPGRR